MDNPIWLRHNKCGEPITLACFEDNVAILVYCDKCRDIVEIGELQINIPSSEQFSWINNPKRKFLIFENK